MKAFRSRKKGQGQKSIVRPMHTYDMQQRRGDTGQAEAAEEIQGGAAHPERDEPAGPTVRRDGRQIEQALRDAEESMSL